MSQENQAELFIRVLAEEFETFRVIRRFGYSRQFKAQARRFRQLCKTDAKPAMTSMEPLDCLQMMSAGPQRSIWL